MFPPALAAELTREAPALLQGAVLAFGIPHRCLSCLIQSVLLPQDSPHPPSPGAPQQGTPLLSLPRIVFPPLFPGLTLISSRRPPDSALLHGLYCHLQRVPHPPSLSLLVFPPAQHSSVSLTGHKLPTAKAMSHKSL